jgi:hypothetical protein
MRKKNFFMLTFALVGTLCVCNAQTKLINGFTYEKIDNRIKPAYNTGS